MTRTQLRDAVNKNCGNRGETTVMNTGFDLAISELLKLHTWGVRKEVMDPVNIVQGQTEVVFGSETYKILELRISTTSTNGKGLALKTRREFFRVFPNLSIVGQGEPCVGYYENGTLTFGPPAQGPYTLDGSLMTKITGYASDGTENPISGTDYAQICWCTAYVKRALAQFDQAAQWDNQFVVAYKLAKADDLKKPELELALQDFDPCDQSGMPVRVSINREQDPFARGDL